MEKKYELSINQINDILDTLRNRFEKNPQRHKDLDWEAVQSRLVINSAKLWSLVEMERTGGEPDVIGLDAHTGEFLFCDCSSETPAGRRNVCYDRAALDARKEHKPATSALDMAETMGIELLTEVQYRQLQLLGEFDTKTSSWVKTPAEVRQRGGALFMDRRYGMVFLYHNGADSYYGVRGFRGLLRV
mgnify:CR=1 FL=1